MEIADVANKVITVYSGVATDQSGQLVNNEESLTTARSLTLTGNATYYVEIEFVETLGTTDARAFWDPTFDNGLDTSGDVLTDGRESSQNVATRKTHDWQIVDPPSTSGFQVTTTPSGVRIPVAVITVAGGVITAPTGTSVARTCFARTYASGKTSIRGLNTRLMPDVFTVRLGSGTANVEDISVSANDRENGILTLGAGTANAHDIGERIFGTAATPVFIDEAVAMDAAAGVDGGGPIPNVAGDGRIRMFQGDTEAGYALSQDPSADTGNSDIQIKNLKEHVDYLASQILEMKYGAGSRDLLGALAPPTAFTSTDTTHSGRTGGIVNARTNTVSVGTGVASWGDFNTSTSGSAQAALQAAHDALPAAGGILYLKAGTYDIVNTTVTLSKNVAMIGDPSSSTIRATGTASALTLDMVGDCSIIDIDILDNASTAAFAIDSSGPSDYKLYMRNCTVDGITFVKTGTCLIEQCVFDSTSTGSHAVDGVMAAMTFRQCSFAVQGVAAGDRCLNPSSASFLTFDRCTFSSNATMAALVEIPAATTDVSFQDCSFTVSGGISTAVATTSGAARLSFIRCRSTLDSGFGTFDGVTDLEMVDCDIEVPQDGSAVILDGASDNVKIRGCRFTQLTTDTLDSGVGLDLSDVAGCVVSECLFDSCDYGMYVWVAQDVAVSNCQFLCPTAIVGRSGIHTSSNSAAPAATASFDRFSVKGCTFAGIADPNAAEIYGIHLEGVAGAHFQCSVSGCDFSFIGHNTSTATKVVAFVSLAPTTSVVHQQPSVINCTYRSITGDVVVNGVHMENVQRAVAHGNNFRDLEVSANASVVENSAIRVTYGDMLTITNNIIRGIGDTVQVLEGGVIHIGDTSQTVQNEVINVSGNQISLCDHSGSGTYSGILLEQNAKSLVVSNNILNAGSNMDKAIYLDGSTGSVRMSNATVTGNVMRDFFSGIEVDMTFIGATEGTLAITGNTIEEFSAQGIDVAGSTTITDLIGITISGNVLRSTLSAFAIVCNAANSIAVTGNSVHLSHASAQCEGITVRQATHGCISGNTIRIISTGITRGIRDTNTSGTGSTYMLIASNQIHLDSANPSSSGIESAGASTKIYANLVVGSANPIKTVTASATQAIGATELNNFAAAP